MKKGEAPLTKTTRPTGWNQDGGELPMSESAVFPRPTQAVIQSDLRDLFRGAVRVVLEMCLDEAAKELVGARRYERKTL